MKKNIVYWAKKGSDKEHALLVAADSVGISPEKAADVISLIFKQYKQALNNPTIPEIHITDEFKLKPSKNKILWRLTRAGLAYKLGITSKEYYNYITYIPRIIWRRIFDFEYIFSNKRRNDDALFWKNNMEQIIKINSEALYNAYLATKDVFISSAPSNAPKLLSEAKMGYFYKKAIRRRLFRKWKIEQYIKDKKN